MGGNKVVNFFDEKCTEKELSNFSDSSNSELLSGTSFWIIHDLGSPDALISIKNSSLSLSLNALPILMTLIQK